MCALRVVLQRQEVNSPHSSSNLARQSGDRQCRNLRVYFSRSTLNGGEGGDSFRPPLSLLLPRPRKSKEAIGQPCSSSSREIITQTDQGYPCPALPSLIPSFSTHFSAYLSLPSPYSSESCSVPMRLCLNHFIVSLPSWAFLLEL